ncbi:hypothetical protein VNO77_03459 [Canavalia gladiata]|uniref:Uncharacterized protein n=1 Tax=Canavalia gladiata TaxID=3824 RepID=A0AAN9MZW7_CANGL
MEALTDDIKATFLKPRFPQRICSSWPPRKRFVTYQQRAVIVWATELGPGAWLFQSLGFATLSHGVNEGYPGSSIRKLARPTCYVIEALLMLNGNYGQNANNFDVAQKDSWELSTGMTEREALVSKVTGGRSDDDGKQKRAT